MPTHRTREKASPIWNSASQINLRYECQTSHIELED